MNLEIFYKTVIECKDHKSSISVDKIDALIGKAKDIPDLKLVFATRNGYQDGAEKKAKSNGVDLLIVREQDDSDWRLKDDTPLIRKIVINVHVEIPPRIVNFFPVLDEDWIREHTDTDFSQSFSIMAQTDQVFIHDIKASKRYSLLDLLDQHQPHGENEYGEFELTKEFENAFLVHSDLKLKLRAYRVVYIRVPPIEQPIEIDFSKELVGVVEYLDKGKKKMVFENKIVDSE